MPDGGSSMPMSSADTATVMDFDEVLARQAGRGDARAFERLYRAHAGRVHGLCLRMARDAAAAEDCPQDAFIRAWRALPRFEARSGFGTWLHRIAVNVVLERRRVPTREEPLPPDPDALGELSWTFDTPVELAEIETAVASLPDGARDALVLCALYGYTSVEAGEMLGVAAGTCKAQLHRARQLLAARLNRGIA
jgi:RNA polymerase sigma-70 factor (ECF subfamily)